MEFYTGKVGTDLRKQAVDFGTLDTVAYATGDIATSGALIVPTMSRAQGMSGKIVRIMVKETTAGTLQRPSMRLWFFNAPLTPAARNAPQAFTSAQLDSFIGTAELLNANYVNCATGVSSVELSLSLPYVMGDTSTSLYIVPEFRSAYTFAASARLIAQIVCEVD